MDCTSQSALNHVESARKHLVTELQNLSVILENLSQKGVLSDEEVRNIQAERDDDDKTKEILDSVIKKGEAACYELLRIIHVTRKRTLRRPTPLSEENTGDSTGTQKFDLHHWISCFSFQEETQMDVNYLQGPRPCHRYQTKLKLKAQKLSNEFWNASKSLFEENRRPDLSYTSLVLDTQKSPSTSKIKKWKRKKSKMSQTEKLRTYIPEDKPEISPTDLLKTQENILLVGKPGIGKTAVVREMLRLWAEKDNKELDYMFYFDMREMSQTTPNMSLEDLLFSAFSEPDGGVDEVLQDIKSNSDNVTIIFDGITDLSSSVVCRLVEKELLPDAKIIITCRRDDEEDFFSGDCLRVEVKGFSEQTIKSYLSATLSEAQKVLSSLELLTLCHVPIYALMVAACSSSEDSPQPCTITEIYINIVRFCLQINSNKTKIKDLNTFINTKREEILSLAETAFHATQEKTVNLTEVPCKDSCVLSFLKPLSISETDTRHTFLHYTLQEFFASVWLLKNPDEIRNVFQQCLTEEMKHMKHSIPFMCRLLNEKSPSWMKCLIPAEELNKTSDWFFKELITTFVPGLHQQDMVDTEDSGLDVDMLFLCQCLYESQCPEACIDLLDKLDYRLDLCGESLDPHSCCAVAYVVNQSKERKIWLNLDDVTISEQGMRQLFGCLQNVQWCDPLPQQLWKIFLLSEEQMDLATLLVLNENQLHLPVEGEKKLFERAVEVIKMMTRKVNVCLYWDRETPVCQSLCESLIEALPHISSLSFRMTNRSPGLWNQEQFHGALERQQRRLLLDLCLKAARHNEQSFPNVVNVLLSLFPNQTDLSNLCLDLYQHVRSEGFLSVIPKLRLLFQSAPAVWTINLSERKTSILLEVLKLQSEKRKVELTGWSDDKSEMRSFLQCLPYISQLSFMPQLSEPLEETRFLGNLFCAAAKRKQQTGEKILEQLLSLCRYKTFPLKEKWCDFLLDLYSYGTKTGLSVLPSLQSVFRSGPAVWSFNLSEGKSSILLEVLKLQSEKKTVDLTDWSDEESEVRSFLQCLPYISQLSLKRFRLDKTTKFFGNLLCAAAEREQQTGEKILEQLSAVCRYEAFPLNDEDDDFETREYRIDFLLDLFSKVKDCETETGLSVLPSVQSVFQSAREIWPVVLSKRKTSILLEVLKLQSEKKQVELTDWPDEESEVRTFLQCLPYISQLCTNALDIRDDEITRLVGDLFCAAAEREQQTGEKILEQLSAVCSYETFPFIVEDVMELSDDEECLPGFLLDLFSYVKDCEIKTGLSILPSVQSVFQSAPAVWYLDLSERKTSILLEVLKLQSEKKPVDLTGLSDDESEMRIFLQCLPYISELSVERLRLHETTGFFRNLFCAAAEREQQTGEKILEQLSSVCRYETFPCKSIELRYEMKYQSDFLLGLFSHLKDCETKTGLSVLPSLQLVFQSTPAVWCINLSERKTSILLEVLKLQPEKKPVELTDWSDEESEVRSFLQCLPYISQLSVALDLRLDETVRLFVNLFCAAAEREQQTGEKILEQLSSVCRYETFPFRSIELRYAMKYQSDFLLGLFSHLKDCETKTGLSVLPSLLSVFQSAPAVWFINLSERKTSILLEVLKLQSGKKPVEVTDWPDEESEVRSFLQCLPYISQLSCFTDFFQRVCSSISVRSRSEAQQLVSLLQLLDFKLLLTGKLSRTTCCSVGRVLQLCGSRVDLSLTATKMSVRRTSLLFRNPTQLHSLRLSNAVALLLFRWVRRSKLMCPLTVEELCLVAQKDQASERELLKVVSSLSSLLRSCSVRQLVLTESCIPAQCLIPLLLHHGPPTIKLSDDHVQQLLVLVHEVQDQVLTLSLLSAVAGDLTSCCLNWELLHYLLQQSPAQTITVNMRKNLFLQESATRLLPFLGRIVIKRPSPSLVMTSIRELYRAHASHMVPSLLKSLDHVINLSCRELDSVDSAALLFTLRHSDGVKVDLRWTSIPAEGTRSILSTLDRVSELSVDRKQLLRFIHCCAASDGQQEAASVLLRTLQQRLDLSCQSCVDLPEEDQTEPLSLTADDCRAASIILKHCSRDTQLNLQDCEVEDGGLDLLFSVLDRVRLKVSKSVLLQQLSLIPVHSERDTVRRAESLGGALGGELDLSHTTLDQRVCGGLVQMLDSCEGLTKLDLSHCQLSDQMLLPLITHLHKVQVLDLSHNKITDASTDVLLQLISIHSSITTVRLFSNDIVDRRPFEKHKQFEMW